jgi:hypothetical protein
MEITNKAARITLTVTGIAAGVILMAPAAVAAPATDSVGTSGPTIQLISAQTGNCLEVAGGSTDEGAAIQQGGCSGAGHQKWQMNNSGGSYELRSVNSGMCLESSGDSVRQASCNGSSDQHGTPKSLGGGLYQIQSEDGSRCLAAVDDVNVRQSECGDGQDQQWKIKM